MSRKPIAPEDCPEPYWHETHRYCPVCTWTVAPRDGEESFEEFRVTDSDMLDERFPNRAAAEMYMRRPQYGRIVTRVLQSRRVIKSAWQDVASSTGEGSDGR